MGNFVDRGKHCRNRRYSLPYLPPCASLCPSSQGHFLDGGKHCRTTALQPALPGALCLCSKLFLAKVWGQTGSKLYGAKSGADYVDNQRRFRIFNEVRPPTATRLNM